MGAGVWERGGGRGGRRVGVLVDVLDEAGVVADGCFRAGEVGELESEIFDGGGERFFLRFYLADLLLEHAGFFEDRAFILCGAGFVGDIAPAECLAVGELGPQGIVLFAEGAAALLQGFPFVEEGDDFEGV